MKQILVATDFSTCAGNAMEYALGLAKTLSFEVCVIHAIGTNEGVDNSIFNAIYIEDYHNNKKEALSAWANTFNKEDFRNVSIKTVCEVGSVSNVLTKYMDANPVELLVMGTMGSTGITSLFGSNVNVMVQKTKTPTLIVPLESKFISNPVITLAVDFSSDDLSVIDVNALNELIEAADLKKLNIVNIIEGNDWKPNEAGESKLKELIGHAELEFKYINESNPTDGIMNFIVSNETDILCVVKHHRNLIYRIFNKSTVNQVMNRSIKAILVLH